jgi:transposase
VAFDDRKRRGPQPLLGKRANERVEHLVQEDSPTDHGWLRSPASLELQAHRPPTVRGAGRSPGKPGDGAPRAPPTRLPLEEAASPRARQRLRGAARAEARQAGGRAANDAGGGGLFFPGRDQAGDQPQGGLLLDAQRETEASSHSGDQPQSVDQRALNFATGRLHWVFGERRNDELFVRLLDKLRRTYRCHKELHLATDSDASHTSKRVRKYVEGSGGRVRLHPLPSWSSESNPVELVWWSLHESVSRNHQCEGLDDLVEFAEGYLKERQPFRLKLGEVYERLERAPP